MLTPDLLSPFFGIVTLPGALVTILVLPLLVRALTLSSKSLADEYRSELSGSRGPWSTTSIFTLYRDFQVQNSGLHSGYRMLFHYSQVIWVMTNGAFMRGTGIL